MDTKINLNLVNENIKYTLSVLEYDLTLTSHNIFFRRIQFI